MRRPPAGLDCVRAWLEGRARFPAGVLLHACGLDHGQRRRVLLYLAARGHVRPVPGREGWWTTQGVL